MKITDPRFKYTPSISTNITTTWKRFGFKRTTECERIARQHGEPSNARNNTRGASVTELNSAKRRFRVRTFAVDGKTATGGE
jgi:hypothetical protein